MEVELHLEQLAVDLDRAARSARERMPAVDRQTFGTSQRSPRDERHREWLRGLLSEMSTVVDQTVRSNGSDSSEGRLYVWPGYDSVRLSGSRVTFEVDHDLRRGLGKFGYDTGVGEDDADSQTRVMQSGVVFPSTGQRMDRTTLYFDAALAPLAHDETRRDTTFSVGGTHNWLALSPTVGPDPLIGFEVRTTPGTVEGRRSFPTIYLDPAKPLEWGNALAERIATACGDTPNSFWPLPARRTAESRADYAARLEVEHRSTAHREIRQRLYSLWLIGCFVADPASVLLDGRGRIWLDDLIRRLQKVEPERARRVEGIRELERNGRSGAPVPIDGTHFTTWGVFTIPYPIADTRSGDDGEESDDLGSGMLLSDFNLPYWYYFAIRQWVASYYLSLRQHENSFLMAERESHRAALDAERELRRQLSHAVGTELTYVATLAQVATQAIAAEHFTVRTPLLRAGIEHYGRDLTDEAFVLRYGKPTALEKSLIETLRVDRGADPLDSDVALVESTLGALPAVVARRVMGALTHEVSRVATENRALVRVDDPAVIAEFERNDEPTRDENALRLVELLGRALLVSFTVYFRKAFPEKGEGGELVCLSSAEALFGDTPDLKTRREVAQDCAHRWRDFVTKAYESTGYAPPYEGVRTWLTRVLNDNSKLRLELPSAEDIVRLKPGCGEFSPFVLQAWLTEALLNALKHTRPVESEAVISVDWKKDDALLLVANTANAENADEVARAVEAAARGVFNAKAGHQGLAFLGYAAKHLFRGRQLHSEFDLPSRILRLQVR